MTLAESIQALVAQVGKIGGESAGLLQRIVDLEAEVSRLRKLVVPFYWNTVTLNFTNGTAASVNLATFLVNPQNRAVTYTVKSGALPSGCTLSGSTVSYNGTGAVGASSVQFSATQGGYVADSAVITASIAAAQVGNRAPVWSVPENYALTPAATAGTAASYSVGVFCSDPDGNAITYSRTGGTAPAGVTVSTAGVVTVPTSVAAGNYTVTVQADDGQNTALADWSVRSTGAGVIWAHRFDSASAPGLYWGQRSINSASGKRCGYISTTATQTGASGTRAEGGVIGDGCYEMYVPAGVPIACNWARPLAPVTAGGGGSYLSYPADLNNAGIQRVNYNKFYSGDGDPGNKDFNGGGGLFASPYDYANNNRTLTGGSYNDAGTEIVYGGVDGFYIQYRIKFKTLPNGDNRLDYVSPNTTGKIFLLGNIERSNPDHEIVQQLHPAQGLYHSLYGANGSIFYGNGQANPTNPQPGATAYPSCSYANPAACWTWKKDKWITVLVHVVPGRQNPSVVSSDWISWLATRAQYFDTAIQVWVAEEGATSYTKIHDYSTYALYYGSTYSQYSLFEGGALANLNAKPGFGAFNVSMFMNEGSTSAVSYSKDFWMLLDQVICSTQPIPCPAA